MDAELKGLLRRSTFVWFLGARLCSGISSQMLLVALAWNIYDLTHSAWDLGLVGLFQFLPALVMTLPAGHAVDRWNRLRIFRYGLLVQAVVAVIAGAAVWTQSDSKELILTLCVVLGLVRAFQMPAQQAMLPSLVPTPWLARAIALAAGVMQVGVIGGPALGGVLYAWDASLDYRKKVGPATFNFHVGATIVEHMKKPNAPGSPLLEYVGFVNAGGVDKVKGNVALSCYLGTHWTVGWRTVYYDGYKQAGAPGDPVYNGAANPTPITTSTPPCLEVPA